MMDSSRLLDRAVASNIITDDQRRRILAMATEPIHATELPADGPDERVGFADENIRLIGGGNDLFVTIGIILLGAGLFFALATYFSDQTLVLSGLLALASWGVAEFVTRQHRMKLSSTVLALMFVASAGTVIGSWVWETFDFATIQTPQQALGFRPAAGQAVLATFGTLIVVSALYFWRFRVPILAGIVALSVTALAFSFAALYFYDGVTEGRMAFPAVQALPDIIASALYIPLICGLAIFATGVALDFHDRERVTIWSDCAFWLHVISAPLLVHPLFILSTGQEVVAGTIEPSLRASILLGGLIVVFVYVALAIDRRSLLIPTLAYFGTLGIYYLVNSAANSTGIPPFALILLVIGALIMIFGAGWQRIRHIVVRPTLPAGLLAKLPPIRLSRKA